MAYYPIKSNESDLASDSDQTVFDADPDTLPRSAWLSPKSNWRLKTALQIFIAFETLLVFALVATNVVSLRTIVHQQETLNAQHSTSFHDTLPTTYSRDRRFMTLDPQYDHLWDEWTADAQIMIPGELPGEGLLQGAYSMFHQMHCLASFRRAIQTARAGEDPGFDYWDNGHWPHCFDYLRNAILCWADDTIEFPAVVDGERLPFIDGSRIVRQCRSPEAMYQRMREDEKRVEQANKEDGLEHEHGHHHEHAKDTAAGNRTGADVPVWGADGKRRQREADEEQ